MGLKLIYYWIITTFYQKKQVGSLAILAFQAYIKHKKIIQKAKISIIERLPRLPNNLGSHFVIFVFLHLDKSNFTIYTNTIKCWEASLANRGCRDKYINKDAILTHQIVLNKKIATLDNLRSQLYILLGSPFQLLSNIEEQDGYKLGAYFIWQEDQQAELIGYQNWSISLDYQINVYKQVIDRLHKRGYNGNIQLKLDLGDNIILIDFVKKKRMKRKNNIINLNNVVQLKLRLVG